jgi:hypothetical protein
VLNSILSKAPKAPRPATSPWLINFDQQTENPGGTFPPGFFIRICER